MPDISFSSFWNLRSARSRRWQMRCLVRACFLASRQTRFCFILTGRGVKELPGAFCKGTNPICKGSILKVQLLPEVFTSDTVVLWVRVSHMSFGRMRVMLVDLEPAEVPSNYQTTLAF